jgi:dTDP-4-dehydrorhamnose reductase
MGIPAFPLTNTYGPYLLAPVCEKYTIKLLTFSSDMAFDESKMAPYFESDKVSPLNIYGSSKATAETNILLANPSAPVVRTSAFLGPCDKFNFIYNTINTLKNNQQVHAPADVCISPTYVPDLVPTALDLLIDNEAGIMHITNDDAVTWLQFAKKIAART